MRIGIDIDGVLTDLEKWHIDFGSKYMYEKFNKRINAIEGYETYDILGVDDKIDDDFWDEYLYEYSINEPARKFSDEVTFKLHEDGYEIYIITARYLTDNNNKLGENMRNIVTNWLKENNIYYDKIIYSPEDKIDICLENKIDIMIDDRVENINDISKKIPVICFNAAYNKMCEGKNIYRAYSWYDIYYIIKNEIEK